MREAILGNTILTLSLSPNAGPCPQEVIGRALWLKSACRWSRIGPGFPGPNGFEPVQYAAGPGIDGWACLSGDPDEITREFKAHPDAPAIVFVVTINQAPWRFSFELASGELLQIPERWPR